MDWRNFHCHDWLLEGTWQQGGPGDKMLLESSTCCFGRGCNLRCYLDRACNAGKQIDGNVDKICGYHPKQRFHQENGNWWRKHGGVNCPPVAKHSTGKLFLYDFIQMLFFPSKTSICRGSSLAVGDFPWPRLITRGNLKTQQPKAESSAVRNRLFFVICCLYLCIAL